MGEIMSSQVRHNEGFTTPLRALFALVAVATLFSNSPWEQPDQLSAVTGYAGPVMWGVIAAFGNKAGWRRHLTAAVAVVYLVLVVGRMAGLHPQ